MAAIEQTPPQMSVSSAVTSLARLRLLTGAILILAALLGVFGTDWDIHWHAVIGRDRTFTPPHDMILISIGASGIVALIAILIETIWTRRHSELRAYTVDFLGVMQSSLGSYIVGFGAVCSAVAFPLDTYWHSLYGVDVSLWAPFHTMIYMGSVLSTLGIIYHLLSATHLAQMQQRRGLIAFGLGSLIVALGILLSKLLTFLTPALRGYHVRLAGFSVSFYPLLMALALVFVLILTVRLVPWNGAATAVVLVALALVVAVSLFVPPATAQLAQAEHEVYVARANQIIAPLIGQTPLLLLAALSIDAAVLLTRRGQGAQNLVAIAATVSMFIVAGGTLLLIGRVALAGGAKSYILSLLLTIPTSLLGYWVARKISETVQELRW